MKSSELLQQLDRWDKKGVWAFSSSTLRLMFSEPEATFQQALARHVTSGLIGRVVKGLYYNPRARSLPANALEEILPFLRPLSFTYVSLESALSEAGVISQIPARLTCMTTGRSGVLCTSFGVVEFVHTHRPLESLNEGVRLTDGRPAPVADPDRALADLRAVGRNLGLVQRP